MLYNYLVIINKRWPASKYYINKAGRPGGGIGSPIVTTATEVILLDAQTGALLRELPLNLPNQPTAGVLKYQTPIIVGKRLFATTGMHYSAQDIGIPNPGDFYHRAVMWELSNDNVDSEDDLNDNAIHEGDSDYE
jgi:hypothetical protein